MVVLCCSYCVAMCFLCLSNGLQMVSYVYVLFRLCFLLMLVALWGQKYLQAVFFSPQYPAAVFFSPPSLSAQYLGSSLLLMQTMGRDRDIRSKHDASPPRRWEPEREAPARRL